MKTFKLTLWFLTLLGQIAFSSVLSETAASMSPGEWRTLSTNGYGGGSILHPCGGNSSILEYADNGAWDPNSEQFLFVGCTHGTCMSYAFVVYDSKTNNWRKESMSGLGTSHAPHHAYHVNAVNPENGDFFYNPNNSSTVYKYSTNGSRSWSTLPGIPMESGRVPQCCKAEAYIPERNGLLWVGPYEGVWFYNGSWSLVGNTALHHGRQGKPTFSMKEYDVVAQYNPVHGQVLFGSGSNFYIYDKSGNVTSKSAPFNAFPGTVRSINSVDPNTGNYLVFTDGGAIWEFNPISNAWNQTGSHSLASGGDIQAAEAAITNYGVVMFVTESNVRLYRHSSGTGTTSTKTPKISAGNFFFQVFPNPIAGQATVVFNKKALNGFSASTKFQIMDIHGRLIKSCDLRSRVVWDTARLPNGIYIFSLSGHQKVFTKQMAVIR